MTNPPHDPWSQPTQGIPARPAGPGAPGADARPTERIATPQAQPNVTPNQPGRVPPPPPGPVGTPPPAPVAKQKRRLRLGDPLSIVLVLVILSALVIAGLLGGELYARHKGNSIVSQVVECVVEDKADTSFSVTPPFLWQHIQKHYTNISIETAGNQIRSAKGMKLNLDLGNIELKEGDASSRGTIGSINASIDWSAEGIKDTVADAIPLIGSFISDVTTNPSAGTLEFGAALGTTVTVKPEVVDGGFSLKVTEISGLGLSLPKETVQPALDTFTSELTKNYPMDIKAQSVQVTDTGVTATLTSQNASIPPSSGNPCFAPLQ